jgi:hypothetical protein
MKRIICMIISCKVVAGYYYGDIGGLSIRLFRA